MADIVYWQFTELPSEMVDIAIKDLGRYNNQVDESVLRGDLINENIRKSKNTWISTNNWIGGWIWYYIQKVNRKNFMYDIIDIDGGTIQYTEYGEGEYYHWHTDDDITRLNTKDIDPDSGTNFTEQNNFVDGQYMRKLSFSLQLSDPKDYVGGELQFLGSDDSTFFAPKQKGSLVVFDSRTKHRVVKVKSGVRRSLVGWVVGPRWK